MPSERWEFTSYDQNFDIPLRGEIILLRYPMCIIDFKYRPTTTLSSANTSHIYTNSYATSDSTRGFKRLKAALHYILVVAVTHDKQKKTITVTFCPIMSYNTTPSGFTGVWDADEWMCKRATDVERLNHLPIPATGWTPRVSPSPEAPNYETVFAGLGGGGYSLSEMLADEYYDPLTDEDIDKAMMGIDGIDPSTFWNFPGASKELREIAQQRQRDAFENEILKWNDNCYVEEDSCYIKEDRCYAREDDKHESMAF